MPEVLGGYWDIFAYGTLRRGYHNHCFVRESLFLGQAVTVRAYAMYVTGGIPYVVAGEALYRVAGEVYRVDTATLLRLDDLEEHPRLYRREEADIVMTDGRAERAWIYFARHVHGKLAASGDFAVVRPLSTI